VKKKPERDRLAATPDEFRSTVESEFDFLVRDHGFELAWSEQSPFHATFLRGALELHVEGTGYGFGAYVHLSYRGESVPAQRVLGQRDEIASPTEKPQLDELRASALRWKTRGSALLRGDESVIEAALAAEREVELRRREQREADVVGTFFSRADKLWKAKQYAALVTLLEPGTHPLGAVWQKRLDFARRAVAQ
jgi:hypothetical protein